MLMFSLRRRNFVSQLLIDVPLTHYIDRTTLGDIKSYPLEHNYYKDMVRKLDMFLCFMFLFAVLTLTVQKPHLFSKIQAIKSFD